MFGNIKKKHKSIIEKLEAAGVDPDDFKPIITSLVKTDPVARKSKGRKTPFVNAVLDWYLDGVIRFPEDIDTVHETLYSFGQLVNLHKIDNRPEDFDSPGDMREAIEPLLEAGRPKRKFDYLDIEYTDGQYTVYRVDNWAQGERAFEDSGWCVKHQDWFFEYTPPFYMVTKNSRRAALFHPMSMQLMDVHDRPVKDKALARVLKPVADEWLPLFIDEMEYAPETTVYGYGHLIDYAELLGRWPEMEGEAALSPILAASYASEVLKGRFKAGEEIISNWADLSYRYALTALEGRFPKGEAAIAKSPDYSARYAEDVLKGRFRKGEPAILENAYPSFDYAKNVIEGRWPEAERVIAGSPIANRYADEVLKDKNPDTWAERYWAKHGGSHAR